MAKPGSVLGLPVLGLPGVGLLGGRFAKPGRVVGVEGRLNAGMLGRPVLGRPVLGCPKLGLPELGRLTLGLPAEEPKDGRELGRLEGGWLDGRRSKVPDGRLGRAVLGRCDGFGLNEGRELEEGFDPNDGRLPVGRPDGLGRLDGRCGLGRLTAGRPAGGLRWGGRALGCREGDGLRDAEGRDLETFG